MTLLDVLALAAYLATAVFLARELFRLAKNQPPAPDPMDGMREHVARQHRDAAK